MMTRLLHWLATVALVVGVMLGLFGASYWVLARHAQIERTFPVAKRPTEKVVDQVQSVLSTVTSTLQGVRDVPVPILTYHYIRQGIDQKTDQLGYRLSVTPALFAQQLDAFQRAGYKTVTPTQFLAGQIDEHSLILSFDDGYRDFYTDAFPALRRRGMTAVAFIVSGFLDDKDQRYMTSDEVREIHKAGIEIGAHTEHHVNLATAQPAKMQEEILGSRFALEKIIEDRIVSLAYPVGKYNNDVVNVVSFAGFRFAVTTHFGVARLSDDHLTLPRIEVHADEPPAKLIARIERSKRESKSTPNSAQPKATTPEPPK